MNEIKIIRSYLRNNNSDIFIDNDLKSLSILRDGRTIKCLSNKSQKLYLLRWFDKVGPYWCAERKSDTSNYWVHRNKEEVIVTDTSIHEALETDSPLISISPSNYCCSDFFAYLITDDGEIEKRIDNYWDYKNTISYIDQVLPVDCWDVFFENLKIRAKSIVIEDTVLKQLSILDFNLEVVEHIYSVIDKINYYYEIENYEQRQEYWQQVQAQNLITDSSDTEKNNAGFTKKMTFNIRTGEHITCYWHGKFSYKGNPYRVHFCYPDDAKDSKCHIAYIGEKLTKR